MNLQGRVALVTGASRGIGAACTDATAHMKDEQVEAIARMTSLRRVGEAEDVAGLVVALVSVWKSE